MILRETARLFVRDHRASDLPGLTALMTSPEEMRFLPELLCPDGDAASAPCESSGSGKRASFAFISGTRVRGRIDSSTGSLPRTNGDRAVATCPPRA